MWRTLSNNAANRWLLSCRSQRNVDSLACVEFVRGLLGRSSNTCAGAPWPTLELLVVSRLSGWDFKFPRFPFI